HTERALKNWKANRKKAGFLPEERAYFDGFFGEVGYVDVHRRLSGDVDGPYTWWSMRGKAFDNDTGWRIDYQMATPALPEAAVKALEHDAGARMDYQMATAALVEAEVKASVDEADGSAERWSHHAPQVTDYDPSSASA